MVTEAIYDVRESDNCPRTFETHFITTLTWGSQRIVLAHNDGDGCEVVEVLEAVGGGDDPLVIDEGASARVSTVGVDNLDLPRPLT